MGQEIARVKRFEDWPVRLSDFLLSRAGVRFQWGVNDCMLFPADCIHALTGHDFGAAGRHQYGTESEAYGCLLSAYGATSLPEAFTRYLGAERDNPLRAGRGDIVVCELAGHVTGGVIDDTGTKACFISEERGLIRVKLSRHMRVWGY